MVQEFREFRVFSNHMNTCFPLGEPVRPTTATLFLSRFRLLKSCGKSPRAYLNPKVLGY